MELQGFSDRLRRVIDLGGVTIAETARLSDLSTNAVQFFLSGRRENPSSESVVALARATGVSLDWLLTGEGKEPTANDVRAAVEAARARAAATATPDPEAA